MKRGVCIFLFLSTLLFSSNIKCQSKDSIKRNVFTPIFDGKEIIPSFEMEEIIITPIYNPDLNWWQKRKNDKLLRNIKKVYPYAKMAGNLYKEMESDLRQMDKESSRKKYTKALEKKLRDEYENDLKKLTVSQGRILLKLLDRETGQSPYELLKELRGAFSASFWQALARVFGTNLKNRYDPKGEDKAIELYVGLIEKGLI